MKNSRVMGVVFCNTTDSKLPELTTQRTMGSVPFGCRYRLVDFILSEMVNAGIRRVGLITKRNYQSLADHVGNGHPWDLAHKTGGLFMLSPYSYAQGGVYKGKMDALNNSMSFFEHSKEDYVIFGTSNVISNFNVSDMIDKHIDSGADITIAYKEGLNAEYSLKLDGDRVVDISENVDNEAGSIGVIMISRTLLMDIVKDATKHNYTDINSDIIKKALQSDVRGYRVDGYVSAIDSMQSYFDANMDLLNINKRKELFYQNSPIFTKLRDDMPARYGFDSSVKNSLVADGCVIEGEVENCIIFRGVKIGKGAVVRNSILMQSTVIEDDVSLDYVVADKNVVFKQGRTLVGCRSFPMVIGKGLTV